MTTRSLIHAVIGSVFMALFWVQAGPLPATREGIWSEPAGNRTFDCGGEKDQALRVFLPHLGSRAEMPVCTPIPPGYGVMLPRIR
jgi:hypothetical protein